MTIRSLLAILLASVCMSAQAQDARPNHPGKAVYDKYCAACHLIPGTRAPALSALQQMSAESLRFALTQGLMQQQGALVPRGEFQPLIDYLAAPDLGGGDWIAKTMCAPERRGVDLSAHQSLTMVGVDLASTRRLTGQQSGLTSADLSKLELAWAVGFPKTTSLRASPVIIGSTLFYSAGPTGKLLALDTQSACVKWAYDAGAPLRASVSYGALGGSGKKALIFGDARGHVHTVDPMTGSLIWKADGRHDAAAGITGAPTLHGDRIIVPVSASGVGAGANPKYECCTGHGAVVALDAATGKQLWVYHTMEDAQYTGKTNSLGVKLRGPSGAPIWASPTIDAKRGVAYVGTGQATSLPATNTSDAILAIDLNTGALKWGFQALERDVWHLGCNFDPSKTTANCPSANDSVLKDYDFGAPPVIARRKDGKEVIIAGQKSGDVWALDPDSGGKVLWRKAFGTGTPLGGVHWGLAIDGERVFAAINDPHLPMADFKPEPGMNAIDIATGEVLWRKPVTADCANGRKERYGLCGERYGLSAAPLVVDQSVIAAGIDGRIYIYDAATGNLIWQFDALRDFETVNGVPGKGGGVDSQSIAAGDGMVFIGAGYSSFGQPGGNVLLGFRPKKAVQ